VSGVWLRDLAEILRKAGIDVREMVYQQGKRKGMHWTTVGFQGRGLTEFRGIMWHHDASPPGDSPGALSWLLYYANDNGYDLTPAAHIWVDRYGTWWIYAAGLSNHAGKGSSALAPNNTGNQYYLGIETDHGMNEEWPKAQLDSLRVGTAAIMRAYDLDPMKALEFHKTYAPGRKPDPDGLDLGEERLIVAKLVETSDENGKRATRIKRRLRQLRRRRDRIRASGRKAGLSTARKKIRALNQRLKKLTGR
jgi:hypothetical protein